MYSVIIVDGACSQFCCVFERAPGNPADGAHGRNGVFCFSARVFGVEVPDSDGSVATAAGTMFSVRVPVHREYRTIMCIDLALVDIVLTVVPSLRCGQNRVTSLSLSSRSGDIYT